MIRYDKVNSKTGKFIKGIIIDICCGKETKIRGSEKEWQ